jgi:hypothetical protein
VQLLITPTVKEPPAGIGPLMFRYGLLRGVSLLVSPQNTVTAVRYPTEDQLAAARVAYLLDDAEAAIIAAAGYGDCLHPSGLD